MPHDARMQSVDQLFIVKPFAPGHEEPGGLALMNFRVLEYRHPIGLPVVDPVGSDLVLVLGDEESRREIGDMLVEVVDPAVHGEYIDPGES